MKMWLILHFLLVCGIHTCISLNSDKGNSASTSDIKTNSYSHYGSYNYTTKSTGTKESSGGKDSKNTKPLEKPKLKEPIKDDEILEGTSSQGSSYYLMPDTIIDDMQHEYDRHRDQGVPHEGYQNERQEGGYEEHFPEPREFGPSPDFYMEDFPIEPLPGLTCSDESDFGTDERSEDNFISKRVMSCKRVKDKQKIPKILAGDLKGYEGKRKRSWVKCDIMKISQCTVVTNYKPLRNRKQNEYSRTEHSFPQEKKIPNQGGYPAYTKPNRHPNRINAVPPHPRGQGSGRPGPPHYIEEGQTKRRNRPKYVSREQDIRGGPDYAPKGEHFEQGGDYPKYSKPNRRHPEHNFNRGQGQHDSRPHNDHVRHEEPRIDRGRNANHHSDRPLFGVEYADVGHKREASKQVPSRVFTGPHSAKEQEEHTGASKNYEKKTRGDSVQLDDSDQSAHQKYVDEEADDKKYGTEKPHHKAFEDASAHGKTLKRYNKSEPEQYHDHGDKSSADEREPKEVYDDFARRTKNEYEYQKELDLKPLAKSKTKSPQKYEEGLHELDKSKGSSGKYYGSRNNAEEPNVKEYPVVQRTEDRGRNQNYQKPQDNHQKGQKGKDYEDERPKVVNRQRGVNVRDFIPRDGVVEQDQVHHQSHREPHRQGPLQNYRGRVVYIQDDERPSEDNTHAQKNNPLREHSNYRQETPEYRQAPTPSVNLAFHENSRSPPNIDRRRQPKFFDSPSERRHPKQPKHPDNQIPEEKYNHGEDVRNYDRSRQLIEGPYVPHHSVENTNRERHNQEPRFHQRHPEGFERHNGHGPKHQHPNDIRGRDVRQRFPGNGDRRLPSNENRHFEPENIHHRPEIRNAIQKNPNNQVYRGPDTIISSPKSADDSYHQKLETGNAQKGLRNGYQGPQIENSVQKGRNRGYREPEVRYPIQEGSNNGYREPEIRYSVPEAPNNRYQGPEIRNDVQKGTNNPYHGPEVKNIAQNGRNIPYQESEVRNSAQKSPDNGYSRPEIRHSDHKSHDSIFQGPEVGNNPYQESEIRNSAQKGPDGGYIRPEIRQDGQKDHGNHNQGPEGRNNPYQESEKRNSVQKGHDNHYNGPEVRNIPYQESEVRNLVQKGPDSGYSRPEIRHGDHNSHDSPLQGPEVRNSDHKTHENRQVHVVYPTESLNREQHVLPSASHSRSTEQPFSQPLQGHDSHSPKNSQLKNESGKFRPINPPHTLKTPEIISALKNPNENIIKNLRILEDNLKKLKFKDRIRHSGLRQIKFPVEFVLQSQRIRDYTNGKAGDGKKKAENGKEKNKLKKFTDLKKSLSGQYQIVES